MSSSTIDSSYENNESVFLKNLEDLNVYVYVICGVLGFLFLLSVVGFICEKLGCLKSKKELRKAKLNNPVYNTADETCHNHYPTWLFDELATIQRNKIQENANKEQFDGVVSTEDPVSFVNAVFSDILDEDDGNKKKQKSVAYEAKQRLIKPEMKPSVAVAYAKVGAKSSVNKEQNKEKIKISLDKESITEEIEEAKVTRAIMIENYDPLQSKPKDEEEVKEGKTVAIPAREFSVGVKPQKVHKKQTVEYEHPMIIAKQREQKRLEEEMQRNKKEEEERTKKRRVVLERSTSKQEVIKKDVAPSKKKRIISDKQSPSSPTNSKSLQDSFLY